MPHSPSKRGWKLIGAWYGKEGARYVFTPANGSHFAVLKVPHAGDRASLKFWSGTSVDKTASHWNMTRDDRPISEMVWTYIVERFRSTCRELVRYPLEFENSLGLIDIDG